MSIYKWLESKPTIAEIEALTGKKVKKLTTGGIETGEYREELNPLGKPVQVPITCEGIEVEFEEEVTDAELNKLDKKFGNLRREGARDLIAEVDELKGKVEKLETRQIR